MVAVFMKFDRPIIGDEFNEFTMQQLDRADPVFYLDTSPVSTRSGLVLGDSRPRGRANQFGI
jgi:hypothetical protein